MTEKKAVNELCSITILFIKDEDYKKSSVYLQKKLTNEKQIHLKNIFSSISVALFQGQSMSLCVPKTTEYGLNEECRAVSPKGCMDLEG